MSLLWLSLTRRLPLARFGMTKVSPKLSMLPNPALSLLVTATPDWRSLLTTWLIKRTFQPSIIRKKRKTGFLVRQRTVGGQRTLNRRAAKGRWRLGGGI